MIYALDPDVLLARVEREENLRKRGQLKIFFGAADGGVGKTYDMLLAAQAKQAEGIDLVGLARLSHKKP